MVLLWSWACRIFQYCEEFSKEVQDTVIQYHFIILAFLNSSYFPNYVKKNLDLLLLVNNLIYFSFNFFQNSVRYKYLYWLFDSLYMQNTNNSIVMPLVELLVMLKLNTQYTP